MSQFLTPIPVDLDGVKRLLPQQHFIEAVNWNPIMQTVDLVWSSPGITTPFSTPQLFPIQHLHDRTLPAGMTYRVKVTDAPSTPVQPVGEKPVDKPKGRGIKTRKE